MSNFGNTGEYIFSTTDPFGKEVRLKSSTWYGHIISGDHDRLALEGEIDTIKNVINNPYYILSNNPHDPNDTRQKYLDIVQLQNYTALKNLLVVVDHQNSNFGDIVTIIPKNTLKQESTEGGPIYVRGKSTFK